MKRTTRNSKFKLRYVLIPLGIIVLFVIGWIALFTFAGQIKNSQEAFEADMDQKVNSIVNERLADFYSNQSSYTPSNPDSVPDTSDDFTDVSWPEDSKPSTSENTSSAESEKITATITNYGASPNDEKHNISMFESYDDAFDNAFVLPSGKNVNINLKASVNIESIKATASGLNPDSGEFDEFDEFSFKSSKNSDNVYKLSFKVPDNPYGLGYKKSQVRFIAVFEIVTNEGTFYVSCAY